MQTQAVTQNTTAKKATTVAAVAAGVTGGLKAFGEYSLQKSILASPDEYISSLKKAKADILKSKDANLDKELVQKMLDNALENINNLVKEGKVNIGTVAKSAFKTAAKSAVVFGGIYLAVKTLKNAITNKKAMVSPKEEDAAKAVKE